VAQRRHTEQSAADIYRPLAEEGEENLRRSSWDLSLSGLIAGLDISFGALAMGVVAGRLHDTFGLSAEQALFLGGFAYPIGFVLVVMGKSELFTENTLAPVAGMIRGNGQVFDLLRTWVLIYTANVVGAVIFALLTSHASQVFDPYKPIYRSMAVALTQQSFLQAMLAAVFAGWLVALIAWLTQATESSITHFFIIYVIAYLLVGLSLFHSIIGSTEVLLGMFAGAPGVTVQSWLWKFLLPATIGNTIGGVVFVTFLKGFQARSGGYRGHAEEEEEE
jgi:formate/nitrite transporter FocA (FNT family)